MPGESTGPFPGCRSGSSTSPPPAPRLGAQRRTQAVQAARALRLLGYSSMVLAALLVFFGIRSYQERTGGGRMSFGRGLAAGAVIAIVSSLVYAAAFEVISFVIEPDFGDHFVACMIERAETSGAGEEELSATSEQARTLKRLYDRPLTNAALTLATTLPVGLVASAISAAILRRR